MRWCSTAAASSAEPSTSGQEGPGWLYQNPKPGKAKGPFLGWIYMRKAPDGTSKFMPLSEALVWAAAVAAISYMIVPRYLDSRKQAADTKAAAATRQAELDAQRQVAIRAYLAGKSWLVDEKDPFDGMTPKQIMEYAKKEFPNPDDPFEGMTPEEIDEYAAKYGLTP